MTVTHAVERAANGAATVAQATVGPWRYATLVVTCPECGSGPGAVCTWDGTRTRRRPHRARYALARQLAGFPLAPRTGTE